MHKNRRTVRVEWGHCDAAKIVYYPRYFEWFDQSTHYLFESAGINLHAIAGENGHSGAPLVGATAKFNSPSRYGDDIQIESEFLEIGRASFKVAHRIYNRGVLAVEGQETRVWAMADPANPGKLKALAIPPDLLARMKQD